MRVRYTPRAAADLERIFDYIDERAPAAAPAVKAYIKSKIDALTQFPFAAPKSKELGVFELSMVRYPYKVYYRIDAEVVSILHIRDARRRPWKGD